MMLSIAPTAFVPPPGFLSETFLQISGQSVLTGKMLDFKHFVRVFRIRAVISDQFDLFLSVQGSAEVSFPVRRCPGISSWIVAAAGNGPSLEQEEELFQVYKQINER